MGYQGVEWVGHSDDQAGATVADAGGEYEGRGGGMNRLLDYARELKKEFETQDHDCQAHPRFWVIMDYRWDTCMEGDEEEFIVCLPTLDVFGQPSQDFLDDQKEFAEEYGPDFLEDLQEIECDVTLLEFLKKHFCEQAYLVPVREGSYIVPNTFFLTKQDAKDYLRKYGYNHSPKAHTYAMTAIRSPKFEKLIDLIMEDDNNETT